MPFVRLVGFSEGDTTMGAATSPTGARSHRPLWFALAALGVLLVVALIVVLVVWRGGAATPSATDDAASSRPTPTASAAPLPVASLAPTNPVGGPAPTSCDEIYSPTMLETFSETHALNPAWTATAEPATRIGTLDPELSGFIAAAQHLTCVWANPVGGSDSGLVTNVVFVTDEQAAAAQERLEAVAQNCYEELGGLRCVMQSETDADGSAGESHFLREGIWLATSYVNAGPDGYTHDLIATIWDGA
jgi:hypothetical protein